HRLAALAGEWLCSGPDPVLLPSRWRLCDPSPATGHPVGRRSRLRSLPSSPYDRRRRDRLLRRTGLHILRLACLGDDLRRLACRAIPASAVRLLAADGAAAALGRGDQCHGGRTGGRRGPEAGGLPGRDCGPWLCPLPLSPCAALRSISTASPRNGFSPR